MTSSSLCSFRVVMVFGSWHTTHSAPREGGRTLQSWADVAARPNRFTHYTIRTVLSLLLVPSTIQCASRRCLMTSPLRGSAISVASYLFGSHCIAPTLLPTRPLR
jgi:hypothetical protein